MKKCNRNTGLICRLKRFHLALLTFDEAMITVIYTQKLPMPPNGG